MTASTLGLIGLGNMGLPVAARLVAQGRTVRVWDASPAQRDRAGARGSVAADSAMQVAKECAVIVLSLPTPSVVRTVMADLLEHIPTGRIVIDLSTNDPGTAQEMAAAAAAHGVAYIDSPVSGGPSRAATGELTLMVGGDEAAVQSVRPLLAQIGKQVEYVGPAGCGCIAKLLNNYVALWGMIGVSQAFLAASALNISTDRLYDVMSRSSGQSYSLSRNFPKIRSGDFSPNFSLTLAEKDLRLALQLMNDAGLTSFAEKDVRALFETSAHERGDKDVAAIYQTLAAMTTPR